MFAKPTGHQHRNKEKCFIHTHQSITDSCDDDCEVRYIHAEENRDPHNGNGKDENDEDERIAVSLFVICFFEDKVI